MKSNYRSKVIEGFVEEKGRMIDKQTDGERKEAAEPYVLDLAHFRKMVHSSCMENDKENFEYQLYKPIK
ncbi:hypothetical protein HanIR_Chr08g0375791 [Helianthus annuus]|nr:hypothetical protein HanIR_Chr08g0375791 [Helianthus annuus]